MFIGKHDRSLDEKGRLVLPSPFRRHIQDGGVLAPWDRCVAVFPRTTFDGVMERLLDKLRDGEADDDVVRRFQADAWEVSLDGQGRFILPESHRAHAEIERDVAVIGQSNRLEVWSAGRYAELVQAKTATDMSGEIRRLRIF
ncbi:MAG: division/cell wall cluster transcriptional repressor MraZ [Acidimicrobiia bacterium]